MTVSAAVTLSSTATSTPKLADHNRRPGATASAATIANASAMPANRIVRPAISTAVTAASSVSEPASSSSRKRDTSSRA